MKQCEKCKMSLNDGGYAYHYKNCMLTPENVINIKKDYIDKNMSIRDLMVKYNVGNSVIRRILNENLRDYSEAYKVCKTGFKEHTIESKAKLSKAMMGNRNANHRGDRQSFYNDIRMDSSWEVLVAKYLDDNKYNWKYSSERYLLSTGQYLHPDFFIYNYKNELEKIIEVKGFFREANKLKFDLFKKEYPNLVIELWNKDKLKELKLIK